MSDPRPATDPPARHERPFRVLAHRDFRLIWSAELLSNTSTQIQRVAVAWQVFALTHDPLQLGLLGLVRFVPLFFFGLAGGVAADFSTAGGRVVGSIVPNNDVQVGGIRVSGLRVAVNPALGHALLGQNFLNKVDMTQGADQLVLRVRN